MSQPVLLDLFCGAGGATKGYQDAGFLVVGVDIKPQPRYVGEEFVQADALEYLATADLSRFDAIHASPPCQAYSLSLRGLVTKDYPELISPTRELLSRTNLPYVIENVVGSTLPTAVILCGMNFGLSMHRHRLFETYPFWNFSEPCRHDLAQTRGRRAFSPYDKDSREAWGVGRGKGGALPLMRELMQVPWMQGQEISEAIPPAYTRYIGAQLLQHIKAVAS